MFSAARSSDLGRAKRLILVALAVAAFLSFGPGGGIVDFAPAGAQEKPRMPVDAKGTQQKAAFLKNLVNKSVAVETIEKSGDAAAIAKLSEARKLVARAQNDLDAGRIEAANEKLNGALALVNEQTRRLSAKDIRTSRQQEAYEKRLHTVEIFIKAYERVVAEKDVSAPASAHVSEVKKMVAEAKGMASEGRHEDANKLLLRAYKIARGDIRELRDGDTLTRSLNFATPADEYRYERDRNDSHFMLLKFAELEKKPPQNFVTKINTMRDEAKQFRKEAERKAAAGQHADAIDALLRSTDTLLKAIRMTGIYIPS